MACSAALQRQVWMLAVNGEGVQQLLSTSGWQLLLRALAAPVKVLHMSGERQHSQLVVLHCLLAHQVLDPAWLGSQLHALKAAANGLLASQDAPDRFGGKLGCCGMLLTGTNRVLLNVQAVFW